MSVSLKEASAVALVHGSIKPEEVAQLVSESGYKTTVKKIVRA